MYLYVFIYTLYIICMIICNLVAQNFVTLMRALALKQKENLD